MKDLEYLSDYRNKRIGKDLDKQMMRHLELHSMVINIYVYM